jgi:acetylornithine/succinyldiaminopimelate/putrescine aminotransferase
MHGLGLLVGLRTRKPAKEVLAALRDRSILAGGSHDLNVVRLLPPLTMEERHVDELVAALRNC